MSNHKSYGKNESESYDSPISKSEESDILGIHKKKSSDVSGKRMLEAKYPKIVIAQTINYLKFSNSADKQAEIEKIISKVSAKKLAYLYKYITLDKGLGYYDEIKYKEMVDETEMNVKKYDDRILQAQEHHKEDEIESIMFERSNYLSYIGNKEGSLSYLDEISLRKNTISGQLKILFHRMRIGFFFCDRKLVSDNLEIASKTIKNSSDWDLKNQFYAYSGLYSMWNRDLNEACNQFLNCTSSFNSYDVMKLSTFCSYSSICALLILPRDKLYSKIINGPELQEGLYHMQSVKKLTDSYYWCDYATFSQSLKQVVNYLQTDLFLRDHVGYLCRELRLKAYKQILISFKSLTLKYLSEIFGLNQKFIETDIARFIAKGNLNCKIDLVVGMVITSHSDQRNTNFTHFIQNTDRLLNNIKFLERIVNEC